MVNNLNVQMLPVVKAGPPQLLFVQLKTEGTDEPQFGSHRQAAATDIPSVLGDLGLVKNDV